MSAILKINRFNPDISKFFQIRTTEDSHDPLV